MKKLVYIFKRINGVTTISTDGDWVLKGGVKNDQKKK